MTRDEANALVDGVYRITWRDGGKSLAAVGKVAFCNQKWLAPCNWLYVPADQDPRELWTIVATAELIEADTPDSAPPKVEPPPYPTPAETLKKLKEGFRKSKSPVAPPPELSLRRPDEAPVARTYKPERNPFERG
jgi:hypothetical protein